MRTSLSRIVLVSLVAALVALMVPASAMPAPQPVRSIVVFDDAASGVSAMQGIERMGGLRVGRIASMNAAVVTLPSASAEKLVSHLAGVKRVERDIVVTILAKKRPAPVPQPAQVLPWGIDRIDAEKVWAAYTGDPIRVAIVDTGIDTAHPDLIDNVKGGVSEVGYTRSYKDDNGHGTHVAGIVASVDNSIGVVGVAPRADLYAVKVLNRSGSGYLSDIINGLDWAVANDMQVVNMSLGTSSYSALFDAAVQRTVAAGVVVVAAAGNSGAGLDTVNYPAKFAGVIAVSATGSNDVLASFSSRGPAVDLAAPGSSVYSTYYKSSYATLSGTSMASPHVAGTAALVLCSPIGADDANANGVWDPAEVERRMERTALDLGTAGYDTLYGNGLVQADLAVIP